MLATKLVRALFVDLARVVPVPGAELARVPGVGIVGEHRRPVEAAGMADIGLVAAGLGMAVHPGHQVAAVAAAGGEDALRVGPGLLEQPVGGGLDVLQLQLAVAVADAVEEGVAEAGGAVVVDAAHHVALRGEGGGVPAVVPAVARGRVRPAVDDVQQRVLLPGVEAGRVAQPHLHLVAERAVEPQLLVAAEGHAGERAVVEALDAARLLARQVGVQARRMLGGVDQRHQRAGALVEAADRAAADHQLGAPVGQVEAPQVLAALLLGA